MDAPRIRIGNQTTADAPAREPFEFALRHGFDAFEWFSDRGRAGWCEADADADARRRLRAIAAEHGLRYSVHAPWAADPADLGGAGAIRRSLDFAADVAARVVVVHLALGRGVAAFVEALGPLLVRARAAGTVLALENTPATGPDEVNAAFAALAAVPEAAGAAGLCLDTGHANLHAGTRNDYLGFVDRLGVHVPIVHWHAHENWGDRDAHLPLFTGPAGRDDAGLRGLIGRLSRRGFRGSVVLEQWPSPPGQLVAARDRLRRLWDAVAVSESS
jgi:sugar phosphate isomerase/epimerase